MKQISLARSIKNAHRGKISRPVVVRPLGSQRTSSVNRSKSVFIVEGCAPQVDKARLNVVGERHDDMGPDLERRCLATAIELPEKEFWKEHEFSIDETFKGEPVKWRGDPPVLRAFQRMKDLETLLKLQSDYYTPVDQVVPKALPGSGTKEVRLRSVELLKKYIGSIASVACSAELESERIETHGEMISSYWLSRESDYFKLNKLMILGKGGGTLRSLACHLNGEFLGHEERLKEIAEKGNLGFPFMRAFSRYKNGFWVLQEKSFGRLERLVRQVIEIMTLMRTPTREHVFGWWPEHGDDAMETNELRSMCMHILAVKAARRGVRGVWKIGESHARDIESRLGHPGEYNLVRRDIYSLWIRQYLQLLD